MVYDYDVQQSKNDHVNIKGGIVNDSSEHERENFLS